MTASKLIYLVDRGLELVGDHPKSWNHLVTMEGSLLMENDYKLSVGLENTKKNYSHGSVSSLCSHNVVLCCLQSWNKASVVCKKCDLASFTKRRIQKNHDIHGIIV